MSRAGMYGAHAVRCSSCKEVYVGKFQRAPDPEQAALLQEKSTIKLWSYDRVIDGLRIPNHLLCGACISEHSANRHRRAASAASERAAEQRAAQQRNVAALRNAGKLGPVVEPRSMDDMRLASEEEEET